MCAISLSQGLKYTLCWVIVESMCVLIGLGAYPETTLPVPGKGPSYKPTGKEMYVGLCTVCTNFLFNFKHLVDTTLIL